jgi:hypothetical protein
MASYQEIAAELHTSPRDIPTAPVRPGYRPRWFYAYEEGGTIYVESGRSHDPKSSISGRRRLSENDFSPMLDLYKRRKNGERISSEALARTRCQVYWYGIFQDFGL